MHKSWEGRKTRNGREANLKREGKPTPEWTREHGKKRCRVCGGSDYQPRASRGKLILECVTCRKKNSHRYYENHKDARLSSSKKIADRWRKMKIPPNPDGPTCVTTKWYHLHQAEVHARCMGGEVFLLEAFGVPYGYLVPTEEYKP